MKSGLRCVCCLERAVQSEDRDRWCRVRGRPGSGSAPEDAADDPQVLETLAIGRPGAFEASIPLHRAVQRERLRHVACAIFLSVAPGG